MRFICLQIPFYGCIKKKIQLSVRQEMLKNAFNALCTRSGLAYFIEKDKIESLLISFEKFYILPPPPPKIERIIFSVKSSQAADGKHTFVNVA